ncbi:MAG: hypothetical protein KF706_00660 [Chitinophagales bacterium]|nr:hypothetical protein [Chitinophagales bacterium]OJV30856.1 MAG: hypothetical protein BGO32_10215 [Bacteroidetes bacterium 37-13]
MNNRIIFLIEAIKTKIQALQSSTFSTIDKDILLEDVRELYRLLQEVEPDKTTSLSNNAEEREDFVQQKTVATNETLVEKEGVAATVATAVNEAEIVQQEAKENSLEELVASLQKELEEAKKNEQETIKANVGEVQEQVEIPQMETLAEEKTNTEKIENSNSYFLNTAEEDTKNVVVGSSLNDSFSSNHATSLNQKAVVEPVKELHNLISSTSSFSSIIDFNNRILFTQELFNGDSQICSAFISQLENCGSLEEAKTAVNTHALTKGWKGDNEAVKTLVKLVRQFYS